MRFIEASNPFTPLLTSNVVDIKAVFIPLIFVDLTVANSLSVIIGWSILRVLQCLGVSSKILGLLPTGTALWVTNSSRMASNGGFDTCAKDCLK